MGGPRIGAFGTDLSELATHLIQNGAKKIVGTPRRVRVLFNNATIVDTTKAVWVWEHDYYPFYYVPTSALQNVSIKEKDVIKIDGAAKASVIEITVPAKDGLPEKKTDRVLGFADDSSLGPLAGLVRLEFKSVDKWLEEDIPIYVHPKDPFKRIELLPSTRHIEIRVAGKTIAKTNFAIHLHETSLPTRYYLPLASVDQSVLRQSNLITSCPYKGDAEYYHVVVDGQEFKDIVWYYRVPTHESLGVAGLVSFYNEKVDILLDGELLEQPKTHFA